MLSRFNEEYPDARLVQDDVFGKRLIFSGFDHRSEIYALAELGARDISVDYYLVSTLKHETLLDNFNKFNILVLNGASYQVKGIAGNPETLKEYAAEFMMFVEKNKNVITFAIEPYFTYSGLGEDHYLDYLEEAYQRNLPIFPVVYRENLDFYIRKVFPKHPYVCVTREMALNKHFMLSLVSAARKAGVVLIGLDLEETATIERHPFVAVINSGWKNGSKYGNTHIYTGSKFEKYENTVKRACREANRDIIKSYPVNYELILDDIASEVDKLNFFSWKDYGDRLRTHFKGSYWLTDLEVAQAKNQYIVSKEGEQVLDLVNYEDRLKGLVTAQNRHVSNFLAQQSASETNWVDVRSIIPARCSDEQGNLCHMADRCPAFNEMASCAFHSYRPVKNREDLKSMLGAVIGDQENRVRQLVLQDRMMGNEVNPETTKEIESLFKNSKILNEIMKNTEVVGNGPGGDDMGVDVTVDTSKGTVSFTQRIMNKAKRPQDVQGKPEPRELPPESTDQIIELQEQDGSSFVAKRQQQPRKAQPLEEE